MFIAAKQFAKVKKELHRCEAKECKIQATCSPRRRLTFAATKKNTCCSEEGDTSQNKSFSFALEKSSFAKAKDPLPRQRMSGWDKNTLFFSQSLAHFPRV